MSSKGGSLAYEASPPTRVDVNFKYFSMAAYKIVRAPSWSGCRLKSGRLTWCQSEPREGPLEQYPSATQRTAANAWCFKTGCFRSKSSTPSARNSDIICEVVSRVAPIKLAISWCVSLMRSRVPSTCGSP